MPDRSVKKKKKKKKKDPLLYTTPIRTHTLLSRIRYFLNFLKLS